MRSDPYGFPEAAAPVQGTGRDAIRALWAGIAALILGAIGPCGCYLPWLLALPLSGAAVYYGTRSSRAPEVTASEGLRAASNAGLAGGLVALVLSLLYVMIFLFYMLYMVVVFGAIALGEL